MPVDHKRINGPEITYPYQLFDKKNTKSLRQQYEEVVSLNGSRKDSRKLEEQRKIFLKTDVVSQAKGSAYIEQGESRVIVSVFDPREIPNKNDYSASGEIYCEFKYAPFSCDKRRLHQQDAEEQQFSAIMRQALESAVFRNEFPNFQVDIYALVLHNDGSCLSAAVTAAGVALAHAGIPMYDLLACVTVGVQGKDILVDPSLNEERLCNVLLQEHELGKRAEHGIVVLALLNTHEQISQFYQTGNLSMESLKKAMDEAIKAAQEVITLVKKCLVKNIVDNIKNDVED